MATNDDFIVKNGLVVRATNLANYQSTSTQTGAITTPGGIGVGENAYIGGQLNVFSTSSFATQLQVGDVTKILSTAVNTATVVPDGNALQVAGGIYAQNINIAGLGFIKGSQILTQADGFKGGVISQPLLINTTTNSTSTTTGALTTPGGIGIGLNMNIGGNLAVTGTTFLSGDVYGGTPQLHLLSTILTSPGPGIASSVTYNGFTATIVTTNTGVLSAVSANAGISINTSTGNIQISNSGVLTVTGDGSTISASYDGTVPGTGNIQLAVTAGLEAITVNGNYTDQTIQINNGSISTTTDITNALYVQGSIGTAKLNVANTSYINGAIIVTTSTLNQYIGGIITQTLRIQNTTSSISTTTGALVVDGGVGVGENLNVGKNTTIGGNLTVSGGLTVVGSYTTVIVNSTQTAFVDPVIDLGTNLNNTPLTINDGKDRGLLLHYNTGATTATDTHAFVGRQASTGELVFLQNVTPGGNENVPNPFSGTFGTAHFGTLKLADTTVSSSTTTGALQVAGGAGIGGALYASSLYDNNNRVVTNVNVTSTLYTVSSAGSGIAVQSTIVTGSNVTVTLTNTGVIGLLGSTGIGLSGTLAPNGMYVGAFTVTNLGALTVRAQDDLYSTWDGQSYYTGNIVVGNSSTLATVTARGQTTPSAMTITNTASSMTVTGNTVTIQPGPGNYALNVAGGITATTLYIAQAGYINNAQIVTSATINAFSGGIINNPLSIANTVSSTSTTTGAFTVAGGVGLGQNLNVWNTIEQWNTATTGLIVNGLSQFNNVINATTITAVKNNLYLTTGTGTGTVWANGVDLLNYDTNIRYVSNTSGNDNNDGLRPTSAYATIAKALSVATTGTKVAIAQGTYTETFPLTIPAGVTVEGAGLRSTIVQPTPGTNTQNGFLLNGETLIADITIANFFKPGYGLAFAPGCKITSKSPYVERISVITKGSVTSSSDPYGFNQADAGNGVKLDASVLSAGSLEPAMLFNEFTAIVPNATGVDMTNGARAELLNGFVYFADKAINAQVGLTGLAGAGQTRLKLQGVTGTFNSGDTITYKDPSGNTLASGTIASNNGTYVYLAGPVWGFETITDRQGKVVTAYGGATQSTAQVKYGTSVYAGSTGTYVEVLSDSDFQFGSLGSYTVEGWIYLTTIGKTNRIYYKGTSGASTIHFSVNSSNLLSAVHGSTTIMGTSALSANQWYYVALVRNSAATDLRIYLNGTIEAYSTGVTSNVNNTDPSDIGGVFGTTTDSLAGYIDDFRISNIARYTANFTAPTAQLTSDVGTILLLNFNGGNGSSAFVDSANGTQNVISSSGGTATRIALADYHQFGAELRCIGSAAVFGNTGVTANGTGTDLKLIAFNMSHIGAGGDLSDDVSLVVQTNEVIQTNNGKVYFQTVDQSGNFRVGNSFLINEQTGNVSFGNANVNLSSLNELQITDGTHYATILPTSISVGNLSIAGNTITALSGGININPSGGNITTINSDLQINGAFGVNILNVSGVVDSTNTQTGTLTVGGGVGIGKNLNIGGTFTSLSSAISTTTIANNALQAINGGIGAQTLYIAQYGYIGSSAIVTTSTIGASLGGVVPNAIHITNTSPNNANTTSGALVVDGGAAVAGNLTIGGNLTLLGGGSVLTNITATTDAYIGASVTKTGTTATINIVNLGVQSLTAGTGITVSASTGTITVGNNATLQNVTDNGNVTTNAVAINNGSISTATTSGNALSVAGGIGATELYLTDNGWIAGAQIVTTATLGQAFSSSTQVTGNFNITNTSSNAFQVSGGAVIGGTVTIGGSLNVAGTVTSINSTSVDIGNKVIYLSTLSGSALLSVGAGIVVGKDPAQYSNAQWASFTFDGGQPGNWISGNGIYPAVNNTVGLGISTNQWSNLYVKAINFDTAQTTSTQYSTSTIVGNTIMTNGGVGASNLYLSNDGWIAGNRIITTANLSTYASVFDGGTIHSPLIERDTTDTNGISTATGSIITWGGAAIGKGLWVGAKATIAGNASVGGNLTVNNTATISSVTTSTSAANGALVITGGIGTLGNIRVAQSVDIGTYLNVQGPAEFAQTVTVDNGTVVLASTASSITAPANLTVTATTGSINLTAATGVTITGALTITGVTNHNSPVVINDPTTTSNSTTGALQVLGGISTQDNVGVGGVIVSFKDFISTSSIGGNSIQALSGGIGAQTLFLAQAGYINGAQIITSATLNSFSGGSIGNQFIITNATNALSTTTGALVVTGGVGIGKDVWIGGNTYLQGDLYVDGTRTIVDSKTIQTGDKIIYLSTSSATSLLAANSGIAIGPVSGAYASFLWDGQSAWKSSASLYPSSGGLSLGGNLNPWGNLYTSNANVTNATSATSSATGALQVAGGIGVGKGIFLGSQLSNTATSTYNALTALGGAYIGGQLNVVGPDAWVNGAQIVTTNNPYNVSFTSSTDSVNTQSGALVVTGGVGIGATLNVGGQTFINNLAESTSTPGANALVVSGGIFADSLLVNTVAVVAGGIVITTATIGNYAFNGGNISKQIIINSATQATSTLTGALQIINGGAGIGGNLWLGQYLNVGGTSTFQSTATFKAISVTTSTFANTATFTSAKASTSSVANNTIQVPTGGIGTNYLYVQTAGYVAGSQIITAANINSFSGGTINNPLAINDPTQATSTQTGAFRVINGGVGIGGNIWSGGSINFVDPTLTVNGYFGANAGLTAVAIGSYSTNQPLAIIQNTNEIARFSTAGLGVGTNNPSYGVDIASPYTAAWSTNTVTNLLRLSSTYWSTNLGADQPVLEFGVSSNDSGITFANWITSGEQAAGNASPLVFAGGTWDNNTTVNTVVEWGRFNASGNLILQNNVTALTGTINSASSNTATQAGNALQVVGGGSFGTLRVVGAAWVGNSPVITAATIGTYSFNGGTITNPLYVNTTTPAVSNSSGAIRTAGGISAVGNIFAGQNLYGTGVIVTNITATNINVPGQPLSINGTVSINTVTDQTGVSTGALQVAGGASIAKSLYVGSNAISTNTIAGNAIQVPNGGIGAQNLYLSGNGYIGNAQIVTSANINSFSGGTINNQLVIGNTTEATSTNTGALQVVGGVGIGKNLWVGGSAYILGDLYVDGTQTILNSTSLQTGDKVLYLSTSAPTAVAANGSGISIGAVGGTYADFYFDGSSSWASKGNITPSSSGAWNLGSNTVPWNTEYVLNSRIQGTTDAVSTLSGALQVIGGAGIGKQLWVGNTLTVFSSVFNLTTSSGGNAIYTPGGIGGAYLTIDKSAYVGGYQVLTAGNIGAYAYNGGVVNNAIVVNTTTPATSISTGSIVANGGIGVAGNAYIGGITVIQSIAQNTAGISSNALQVAGGIGANTLYLASNGYIAGAQIVTSANINSFSGGTINSSLVINSSTQAVSTVTGALQVVNGGVGIGGNIYNGGVIVTGITTNQPNSLGNTATGSLQVLGGGAFSGNLTVGGQGSFAGNLGINTTNPGVALEVNGNIVAGSFSSSRVQITSAGGSQAIYEVSGSETNPRWQIGRDLIAIGTAGIAFIPASGTYATQGAAVGQVSGLTGYLGFYTSNGTSMQPRGNIDTGGNLVLGATGAATSGYKLDVRGSSRFLSASGAAHQFLTNNANNYVSLEVTRTGAGAQADWRVGVNGSAGNFLATAAQGDAVMSFGSNLIVAYQQNYEAMRINPTYVQIATATAAVSTTSGALQVGGGVGIQGDLYVGASANITGTTVISQSIASTSSILGNALQVKGGIGAQSLYLTNPGWINGYQIVTTQNVGSFTGAFNGGTITSPLFINYNQNATSTSSGALYTTGGIGVQQDIYVAGNATVLQNANLLGSNTSISGIASVNNATQATSTTTAALKVVNGGLGVGGNIYSSGNFVITTATNQVRFTVQANGLVGISTATLDTNYSLTVQRQTGGTGSIMLQGDNVTVGMPNIAFKNTIGGATATLGFDGTNLTASGGVIVSGTTNATASTATGALQVVGGASVGSTLTVGNGLNVLNGTSALQAVTAAGVVQITNATSATSTTTGALQVTGGVGIQGDLYARNIYMSGTLVGTGSGGGSGGSSTSTPYIAVTSSTISVSTLTGAEIVTGGVGIGKDLFVGGPISVGLNTYINSSALIQAAGAIQSTGAQVAPQHYAQAGNNLVQSQNFSTNWGAFNVTANAAQTYSPDGTLNAYKIAETGSSSGNHFIQQSGLSLAGPVTYSAFLQASDRAWGSLVVTVGGQQHAAWFNLTAGSGAVGNTYAPLYSTQSRIEPVQYAGGGNWYRCSITIWAPASATTTVTGIYVASGNDTLLSGTNSFYTGSAGLGIYAWGAQLESGYYPGAYTQTTTSANTAVGNIYSNGSLYVASTATVAGSTVTTQATLMTQFGGTTPNTVVFSNTATSTSTTTGALVVNGGVGVGGNLYVQGTLYATAKSFLIDHPSKDGYKLQYASLEGPENGVYVRGKLSGSNTIELPDYWKDLVDENSITVDLTPIGYHQKLYVSEIGNNKIVVGNSNLIGAKINCFYTVWAERKDIGKLKTEYKG